MLYRKLLLGTSMIVGLAGVTVATASSARELDAPPPAAAVAPLQTADSGASADEVEALVVTGSRIRRTDFNSPDPVQVISSEQAQVRGIADMSELLQTATTASGSFQINNQLTGYVTDGGPGGNSVSLRGLGAQRTLILLNGRRAGPAGIGGTVGPFDLNVIPQSLVDHVEILKSGASSVYGSDAVAGVINIITKTNIDGLEVNFYGTQPQHSGGEVYRFNATAGKTFSRGYVNGGFDYYQQKALLNKQRSYTACAQDYLFDAATGERVDYKGLDGKLKCVNLNNGYVSAGGMNLVPTVAGVTYPTSAQGNNSPFAGYARFARSGFPLTYPYQPSESTLYDNSTSISPVKRYTATLSAGFDITPKVQAYTELMFNRRESSQTGAGQIFQSFAQRNIVNGAPNNLPASNPNNPFGVSATTVTAYKSGGEQNVDYYRGVLGLKGSFDVLGGWDWDIYGQYSKSDGTYNLGPRIYLDRLLALNSPNVACTNNPLGGNVSNFNCSALPNGIPWASARVLSGQFTDAERNFLFFQEEGKTTYTHKYIEGFTSGDLFSLPAGKVGAAFGFQVRKEELNDQPGPQALLRNVALYSTAGVTKGSDSVKEAYGELNVPVLKGLPLVESLNVDLSGRISDYKSYGTSKTYKVGVDWQLVPSVRLRASQGTSFRAPSLYEQYLGNQTSYLSQSSIDPCYNYGALQTNATIIKNCASQGIPDNYLATGGSSAIIYANGGRDILEAETSKARMVGVVWTPSFADFRLSLDYFDYDVKNEIRQFGSANILEQCYKDDKFPTSAYCTLFQRDPVTHFISYVNNSYVNVAAEKNTGLDLTTDYGLDTSLGRFSLNTQFTWQFKDKTTLLGESEPEDYNGSTQEPDFTGQVESAFERGDWTYSWLVNLIGKASDTELQGADVFGSTKYGKPVYYKQYTEFSTYHTLSVRYKKDDWSATAGVINVFGEEPPAQSTGQFRRGVAALNEFDLIGRRLFINLSKRW
ncbi:MAG: TonB-dependent receptor [Caulobacter sp.]|nr:TonB-dependent receptor [Caulobacter sp.]